MDDGNETAFELANAEFEASKKDLEEKGAILGPFTDEYVKLYNTLLKSHESEQRITKRTRELITEINSNQEKILKASSEEEEIQATKIRLQSEIEAAWAQVTHYIQQHFSCLPFWDCFNSCVCLHFISVAHV